MIDKDRRSEFRKGMMAIVGRASAANASTGANHLLCDTLRRHARMPRLVPAQSADARAALDGLPVTSVDGVHEAFTRPPSLFAG